MLIPSAEDGVRVSNLMILDRTYLNFPKPTQPNSYFKTTESVGLYCLVTHKIVLKTNLRMNCDKIMAHYPT